MLGYFSAGRTIRHILFWVLVYLFFYGLQVVVPLLLFGSLNTDVSANWIRRWEFYLLIHLPIMLFYSYAAAYKLPPLVIAAQYGRFSLYLLILIVLTWFLFGALRLIYEAAPMLAEQPIHSWFRTIKQILSNNLFLLDFIGSPFFRINIAAGLLIGIRFSNQWRQKQKENQLLEREKLQKELQLLKLQLNPNFLLGSLRALLSLSKRQSVTAPAVVLQFAHLLRYVLYESQSSLIPLHREIEIVERYVALQQLIYPSGLEVSFSVRGNGQDRMVAPLILFKVVEHAFRGLVGRQPGLGTDEQAWVSIDLVTADHLTLKVIDGQGYQPAAKSKELADIEKQLYFHYADGYDLRVNSNPNAYIVTLVLPWMDQPHDEPV